MVYLTQADEIVLQNLERDISRHCAHGSVNSVHTGGLQKSPSTDTSDGDDGGTARVKSSGKQDPLTACEDDSTSQDVETIATLLALASRPQVFTTWDDRHLGASLKTWIITPYTRWAQNIVRRPVDVVFLTHILLYTTVLVPDSIYLCFYFGWIHGILHTLFALWCMGPWTLLLHNHIHNGGVLAQRYSLVDRTLPYILGPFLGHTWNSYYWHHVKHHHVENNGPGDLSSTIRYQRDSIADFSIYVIRFLALVWLEVPYYFIRKGQYFNAIRQTAAESSCLALIWFATTKIPAAACCTVVIPLAVMRMMLMVGNWGQHCFVDEYDPKSDFRSSVTLINEGSNRYCFNDGYHTSHHLNARRHWSEHPASFIKAKARYAGEGALTFQDIDYIMLTVKVLSKDWDHLARCLVPMGDQVAMSHQQKVDMLRSKVRRFTEEEIQAKYGKGCEQTVRTC